MTDRQQGLEEHFRKWEEMKRRQRFKQDFAEACFYLLCVGSLLAATLVTL